MCPFRRVLLYTLYVVFCALYEMQPIPFFDSPTQNKNVLYVDFLTQRTIFISQGARRRGQFRRVHFVEDLYEMHPTKLTSTKCTLRNCALRNALYEMPFRRVHFVGVLYEMHPTKLRSTKCALRNCALRNALYEMHFVECISQDGRKKEQTTNFLPSTQFQHLFST